MECQVIQAIKKYQVLLIISFSLSLFRALIFSSRIFLSLSPSLSEPSITSHRLRRIKRRDLLILIFSSSFQSNSFPFLLYSSSSSCASSLSCSSSFHFVEIPLDNDEVLLLASSADHLSISIQSNDC